MGKLSRFHLHIFAVIMNAKSLLIAVICISAVLASGPIFIMTPGSRYTR